MKKIIALTLAFATLTLSACSSGNSNSASTMEDGKITVGATAVPHAEILREAIPMLAEDGITLEVVEFADYTVINPSLASGEIDVNFFQHTAYLENYTSESGDNLLSVGGIHIEPMGLYSNFISSLKDIADEAIIAIPNDATNAPRALQLLAENGLFTLDPSATSPTIFDITDNPKNIEIIEMDAATLPRTLDDVTASVINTNYALEGNLNPMQDAIIMEGSDSVYVNVLVTREVDKDKDEVTALYEALTSPKITDFIISQYEGAVVPIS